MENASKLMIIGFSTMLFASAVMLTLLMYYGVIDMVEFMQSRHIPRQIMEGYR